MADTAKAAFSQTKALIEKCENLDRQLVRVANSRLAQQSRVRDCLQRLRREAAGQILSGMDVDCINREKLGLRVSALRAAGIYNMAQLCALSRNEITQLPGIGEESAIIIHKKARQTALEAESAVRIRLDAKSDSPAQRELIEILGKSLAVEQAVDSCGRTYSRWHASLSEALRAAAPAAGRLAWFLSSARRKESSVSAADKLRQLYSGGFGQEAVAALSGYKAAQEAALSLDYRAEFEKRSAEFYTQLEKLGGAEMALPDGGRGMLPAELVAQVEAQPLNCEGLKAQLRSYQQFGTKYILHQKKVLLGDEMGLGKTMQAIAAMVSLSAEGATHFMVVCPASVVVNWRREISRFSELSAYALKGSDRTALDMWLNKGGVAVCSYDTISRFSLPEGWRFSLLVADEAHYAKNPGAMRTQALIRLSSSANRCLYMTGTPLENNVDEMCYLIRCLRPDIYEQLEGRKYFSAAAEFRRLVSPVYLRRTREDVLTELPELIEKEQWCRLGAEEAALYYTAVAGRNFMAMRQVSWLSGSPEKSAKGRRLLELCESAAAEGRKVLVFSFFRNTIDKACAILSSRCLEPITGSLSSQKRQEIIDRFTAAEPGTVLVCQIQAGGTGLNIQAASVVIFCEPQIKPSLETQAVARAYRMGQLNSVLVYRLLCEDTVDERITELLREKQDVFDSFADESAAGQEYIKKEQSLAAAIMDSEQERLKNKES